MKDLPYVFVSILPFTSSKDGFPKEEILSWQKNFSYADLGTLQLCLKELMVSLFSFFFFFFLIFSHKLHEVFGVVTGGIRVSVGTLGPIGFKMLLQILFHKLMIEFCLVITGINKSYYSTNTGTLRCTKHKYLLNLELCNRKWNVLLKIAMKKAITFANPMRGPMM